MPLPTATLYFYFIAMNSRPSLPLYDHVDSYSHLLWVTGGDKQDLVRSLNYPLG